MNKSLLLVLFVVVSVFFSTSVFAETKVLHNAWHEYADTFTVDGKVIDMRLGENSNSLLRVKVDNESSLIEKEGCKEIDIYMVCYVNNSYDVKQSTISDSGKTMPGVQMTISYEDLSSDVLITSSLSNFYIFQEYKINVTFKNKKSQWIDLFTYEIKLPEEVSIVKPGDFTIIGPGRLSYTGSLSPNAEKTISYTVKADSFGVKKANTTINITGVGKTSSMKGSVNFNVLSPYAISAAFTPTTVNVLDTSKLVITIKNTGTANLELSNLTIEGDDELGYTAERGLEIYAFGKYYLTDKEIIVPGKTKDYYLIVTPAYLGKYNFSINSYMKYNEENLVFNLNKTLISSAGGFAPILELGKGAALSGSNVEVYFLVSNTNPDLIFSDITASISGGFISENVSLAKLNAYEDKLLIRKFIDVPYVDKDVTYKVTATTNYLTQAGQKKQINVSKNLKITSNGSLLSLSHKLSAKEIYTGDELIVELNVKNMKDEVFQVGTKDILPLSAEKIGGIYYRNFTLRGLSTESAYIYKVFVPLESDITLLNITSIASISEQGYTKNYTSTVKVKKNLTAIKSGAGISGTVSDKGANSVNASQIDVKTSGSAEQNKEDGKLKKFFRGISDFFENLFS